ncbi:aldo/keto reductase [Microbacterium sp. LTA6]|uniref:aldo/keto reductase n=1 Tax=unclassified Microbacterium TaxID=2609290 RepID=UPI003139F952
MTPTPSSTLRPAPAASVSLAGREVPRLGFGALHLAGPGGWGAPVDRRAAIALVRGAVDAGIRYIDTADSLGPDVSEAVIAEALWPYPRDVVIATKAGMLRTGPTGWSALGQPAYLRQQAHASALRLRLDSIPLFYLHRIDPTYPLEDQVGALLELRDEGVIEHIGLSAVTLSQLHAAQQIAPIAAVQNHYNVVSRGSGDVLAAAEDAGIPFVSFWSLGHGRTLLDDPAIVALAAEARLSAATLLLAWILHSSRASLPLVGTGRIVHLHDNVEALRVELPAGVLGRLDAWAANRDPVPAFQTR